MFKVMQQYGTVAQPATVYYCDDETDLQNIKSAPMGRKHWLSTQAISISPILPGSSTRCKDGGV